MKFFQVREKSGNFVDEKDLESQRKVREFENEWQWLAVLEYLFILFKREKDVLSHEIVKAHLLPESSLGATLKDKTLLPWGANSFL